MRHTRSLRRSFTGVLQSGFRCDHLMIVLLLLISCGTAAASQREEPKLVDVGGFKLNSILLNAGRQAELPPIVFIHGASTSLYDPMLSFRERLEGRAKLLFVDRPAHGQSDSGGPENILPDGQADAIATLMDKRHIQKAIIVGHSFGGAIAAALAVRHPEKVAGLVFLSPAVYPWPGGVAWYYDAARPPLIGDLFSVVVAAPLGVLAIDRATKAVFAPNSVPAGYIEKTKAFQALRPGAFRHNAQEVGALSDWAKTFSPRYRSISAPTVIITGDADGIVSPEIHARHLARDIRGSRLIMVHNLGHKSDYVTSDLAVAAIERVAGRNVDLRSVARAVERRIANDGKD
ncbi:pimeloyl-ACP methyl ester carboxylesterase [Neorhizobium alkalisoli]|uniref:Pimeloyl-ACP methyl ester carboxylesterase n=2 Tax=Neorhizobium alkalisoli TaxID=528178 RepID=A0A561QB86_9HYPH|nr:pimeloyl-ACP methyl ester carboxylesterase [Neorhizobium alkalisoli]